LIEWVSFPVPGEAIGTRVSGRAGAQRPSRVERLRQRYGWLDRLIRAAARYLRCNGDYYAAAITYFSVLALVPLLMIGFAVAGFILAGNPALLGDLSTSIANAVPNRELSDSLNFVISQSVRSAGAVGTIGLLVALYSGLSWMTALREALSVQWSQEPVAVPVAKRLFFDLLALIGLGVAMAISFGITIAGGQLGHVLADGAGDPVLAAMALTVVAIALSLMANWLVFLWVLARLPRQSVPLRHAMSGAVFAAVGFEVLKQVGVLYVSSVTGSPVGAAFGPVLGLLVFVYLTARFVLFVAAWTAVGHDHLDEVAPPPPAPAVIRPQVLVRSGIPPASAAALLGAGAVLGWALRRRR
jgi:membrane protein